MSKNGKYETKLFIDGSWKIITIDDYFPLKSKWEEKKGRESKLPDGLPLMFCKSTQKQIWAPLIEKAYAKAHGSYKAISGGWIHEALFDLTSFPTETISFASAQFDSELFWTRRMYINIYILIASIYMLSFCRILIFLISSFFSST